MSTAAADRPGPRDARPSRRRVPSRVVVAAVLAAALLSGPSRAVSTVLRTVHRQAAFLPAFSAEPTVTVGIGRPTPGQPVGRYVAVEATALADAGLAKVRCAAHGALVGELIPPSTPTAWRYAVVWDSQSTPEGTASIEVAAEDVAGRSATATVEVRVDHTAPRVTLSPAAGPDAWAFSPNGDGVRDRIAIAMTTSEQAQIGVVVRQGAASRSLLAAGAPRLRATFGWDGRMSATAGSRIGADGRYAVVLHVVDVAGNAVETTHTAIIDRMPPTASWVAVRPPAFWPAKRRRGVFRVRARDDYTRVRLDVDVTNDASAVVRTLAGAPRGPGVAKVAWDGRYANGKIVPPGEFRAAVQVSDLAGNATRLDKRSVRVHAIRKPVTIISVRMKKKLVALTFDDLYSSSKTREILRILREHSAKATFFAVGGAARANPSVMREIVAQGHALGDHSQTHPVMTKLDPSAQRAQIRASEAVIRSITGRTTSPLFRPPYGSTDKNVAASSAAEEHPYVFLWDIDTMDWASPGVDRIIRSVSRDLRPGSIVLMHGGPPQTPKALPSILNTIESRGYKAVTLPELLWAGGYR